MAIRLQLGSVQVFIGLRWFIDDIPHFHLYTESRVIHSLSRITRNALAVMTAIFFVALLRYVLNQIVKSECQRPHGVSGHEEVISNATNSIPTDTCLHTFRS
jgi:hypothetical protein